MPSFASVNVLLKSTRAEILIFDIFQECFEVVHAVLANPHFLTFKCVVATNIILFQL
jgi:hypothetical protein